MTYANPGQPWAAPPARRSSGMAVASLVLGIIALISSFSVIGGILFGLLALIFGLVARSRVKKGVGEGGGMAIGGIVTGVLGLLISVALIAFGVSILNSKAGKSYQSCINNAGGDQAAIQQCQQQFNRDLGGS